MEHNSDRLGEVYPLLKDFLYHLTSYRRISTSLNELPGECEFWVYTCNAHLQNAALKWCMVFGADSNETHWKKIFDGNSDEARKSFMKYLYDTNNISQENFNEYCDGIKKFRNKYIAHKGGYIKPVPCFDIACTVLYSFDVWIREYINNNGGNTERVIVAELDFPSFEVLQREYQRDIENTILKIVKRTNTLYQWFTSLILRKVGCFFVICLI